MEQKHHELIRIEKGIYESSSKRPLSGLYLYLLSAHKTAVFCNNPDTIRCITDLLTGEMQLQSGDIFLNETRVSYESAAALLKRSTFLISESGQFAANLSILKNYFIYMPDRILLRSSRRLKEEIMRRLDGLPIPFDLSSPAFTLTPLQRCIAELYLAYISGRKVMILQHLSGFLSSAESERLLSFADLLFRRGISFLVIDYNMDFLKAHCTDGFVIRGGLTIARLAREDFSRIESYFEVPAFPKQFKTAPEDAPSPSHYFSFRHVSYFALKDLSFHIHTGQILAIVCSQYGEYQSMVDLLIGHIPPDEGEILLMHKKFPSADSRAARKEGLVVMYENAAQDMLDDSFDIMSNCMSSLLPKISQPFFSRKYADSIDARLSDYYTFEEFHHGVGDLSLEERRKLVLCKIMLQTPKVLLCLRPFSYANPALVKSTQEMLKEIAHSGTAVLILSLQGTPLEDPEIESHTLSHGSLIN